MLLHKALNHTNYGIYIDCSKDASEMYIGEYRSLFLTLSGEECSQGKIALFWGFYENSLHGSTKKKESLAIETARLLAALFAEEQKRFSKIDPPNLKDVPFLLDSIIKEVWTYFHPEW